MTYIHTTDFRLLGHLFNAVTKFLLGKTNSYSETYIFRMSSLDFFFSDVLGFTPRIPYCRPTSVVSLCIATDADNKVTVGLKLMNRRNNDHHIVHRFTIKDVYPHLYTECDWISKLQPTTPSIAVTIDGAHASIKEHTRFNILGRYIAATLDKESPTVTSIVNNDGIAYSTISSLYRFLLPRCIEDIDFRFKLDNALKDNPLFVYTNGGIIEDRSTEANNRLQQSQETDSTDGCSMEVTSLLVHRNQDSSEDEAYKRWLYDNKDFVEQALPIVKALASLLAIANKK